MKNNIFTLIVTHPRKPITLLLTFFPDGRSHDHPNMVNEWLDDMREWAVRAPDIIFYLLNSEAKHRHGV